MSDYQGFGSHPWLSRGTVWVAVAMLLAAGCGSGEAQVTTTSTTLDVSTTAIGAPATTSPTPPTTTTTAAPTTTTTTPAITSTTVPRAEEPPVIELDGYTTVYSQDGQLRVSGWLNRPAEVVVGEVAAEVYDDQYTGISTFETVLDLEPGEHGIPITATDARGLENEIYLSVLVDPALEMQLALIEGIDLVERFLVADYIELLHGDEATVAAREDGAIGEGEETPGGFYLRNRNPQLRTLALGDLRVVTVQACLENGPCAADRAVDIDTWVELRADPDMAEEQIGWFWYGAGISPYWLTLQDGVVVQIVEQYLP